MIATYRENKLLYILIFLSVIIFSYLWSQNPIIKSFTFLFLLLVFAFLFAIEFPVYSFMIFLTLYSDIGGYLGSISYFGLPSRVQVRDVAFILCFLPLFSYRIKDKRFWNDRAFRKLLIVLFAFNLYQIFVSELIKRNPSLDEFVWFFLDLRWLLFGVYVAIPAYIVIKQDAKKVFNFMVFVTTIVMAIYFTTLITGINLIEVVTIERFSKTGMMRLSMINYGYMQLVVLMGLALFILKYKYKYRKILMFAAIAMIITQLMTLSRIMVFTVFGTICMMALVAKRFLKIGLSKSINRIMVGIVIITILIFIFFPKYPIFLHKTYKGTFQEIIGKIPRGTYQTRTEYELPIQIAAFRTDPFFGYGYKEGAYSFEGRQALHVGDLPLLGNLALYGVIGFCVYLFTYVLIYRHIKFVCRRIRSNFSYANLLNKYELVFLLVCTSIFFGLVFFRLFYFGHELVDASGYERIFWGFIFGMFFGLANKLEINSAEKI